MGKLDIKRIYERVEEQRKYGLLREDGEDAANGSSSSGEKEEGSSKEAAPKAAEEKVTVDSLVKDMMKLEPS